MLRWINPLNTMTNTLKLIAAQDASSGARDQKFIELSNHADPAELSLQGIEQIRLNFPKFTDGRAFSQAYLLRRRLGFKGDLCATGDVLVDQLLQMRRCGFSSAVLRADQDMDHAQRQLSHFAGYFQGDATHPQPLFTSEGASA